MKKIAIIFGFALLFFACSSPDNKAKLDKLKKEKDKLTTEITALEKGTDAARPVDPASNVSDCTAVFR